MSLLDLDRYYTPLSVARSVVEVSGASVVRTCLDSACGDGNLLSAVTDVHDSAKCIGMDVDVAAVRRLRSRHPKWILSRADALAAATWVRSRAGQEGVGCDLAVLNPPFSMHRSKGVQINFPEFQGRCSVAMAHVLSVLTRAAPNKCCAIVPESFLYSDLDVMARTLISTRYAIRCVKGLRNSTFRGTRANALVVLFSKRDGCLTNARRLRYDEVALSSATPSSLTIIRGGLPIFQAKLRRSGGAHYIHSTNLGGLTGGELDLTMKRVDPIARGVVSGHMLLLPRVGLPSRDQTQVVFLRRRAQLSDCVIALRFSSLAIAETWCTRIHNRWNAFKSLYRGTGARYVTVERLTKWLYKLECSSKQVRELDSRQSCGS